MGKKVLTREEVLHRFFLAHGIEYEYDEVAYLNGHTKVRIRCKEHGIFKQSPTKHWNGQGCPLCRYGKLSKKKTSDLESFIPKAVKVHGSEDYSYHLAEYIDSYTDIEIFCNKHGGSFWQTPSQHLAGSGCSKCAGYGYSSELPGYFYILESEDILKIGITNRQSDARTKKISASAGREFKTRLKVCFSDGGIPRIVEKNLLKMLRQNYLQPDESFDGVTECFKGLTYNALESHFISEVQSVYQ